MPLNISDTKKFHGTYRGIVLNNKDPEGHRRVQVQIPMLSDGIVSNWAWPRFVAGQRAAIPAVGEGVWIDFEAGDPAYPIWTGTFGKNQAANKQIAINPLANTVVTTDIDDILKIDSKVDGTKEIDLTTTVANLTRQHFYGDFYSTSTQTGSTSTPTAVTYNQTTASKGVSIVSNSRITIKYPGTYIIHFNSVFVNTNNSKHTVELFLRKDGSNVAWSNTLFSAEGGGHYLVCSRSWQVACTAPNQYWEIMWKPTNVNITLQTTAAGSTPAVPSANISVTQHR